MSPPKDGGPAFPLTASVEAALMNPGMSLRDWFAGKAPVSFDVAVEIYGGEPSLHRDDERAAFFAVWTMLRYEWADAMLAEREKGGGA